MTDDPIPPNSYNHYHSSQSSWNSRRGNLYNKRTEQNKSSQKWIQKRWFHSAFYVHEITLLRTNIKTNNVHNFGSRRLPVLRNVGFVLLQDQIFSTCALYLRRQTRCIVQFGTNSWSYEAEMWFAYFPAGGDEQARRVWWPCAPFSSNIFSYTLPDRGTW